MPRPLAGETGAVGALPPVILMTGVDDPRRLERAKQLGVAKVFEKGHYSLEDLLNCIGEQCERAGG